MAICKRRLCNLFACTSEWLHHPRHGPQLCPPLVLVDWQPQALPRPAAPSCRVRIGTSPASFPQAEARPVATRKELARRVSSPTLTTPRRRRPSMSLPRAASHRKTPTTDPELGSHPPITMRRPTPSRRSTSRAGAAERRQLVAVQPRLQLSALSRRQGGKQPPDVRLRGICALLHKHVLRCW